MKPFSQHGRRYIFEILLLRSPRTVTVLGTFPYNTEHLKVYITSPITAHRDRVLAVSRTFLNDSEYCLVITYNYSFPQFRLRAT